MTPESQTLFWKSMTNSCTKTSQSGPRVLQCQGHMPMLTVS